MRRKMPTNRLKVKLVFLDPTTGIQKDEVQAPALVDVNAGTVVTDYGDFNRETGERLEGDEKQLKWVLAPGELARVNQVFPPPEWSQVTKPRVKIREEPVERVRVVERVRIKEEESFFSKWERVIKQVKRVRIK